MVLTLVDEMEREGIQEREELRMHKALHKQIIVHHQDCTPIIYLKLPMPYQALLVSTTTYPLMNKSEKEKNIKFNTDT